MTRDPYDEPIPVVATLAVIFAAVLMVTLLGLLIVLVAQGGP